jgi:hypothetical protein
MQKYRVMPQENIFTSLQEAVNWVDKNKDKGCVCPCCNQIAKIYKRKLIVNYVLGMFYLHKLHKKYPNRDYFHISELGVSNNYFSAFAQLKCWDLISEMEKPKDVKSKRTSGSWALTEKGNLFIEGKINVESHVYMYNASFLGYSDKKISITDAIGNKFNYEEMMNS